MWDLVKYDTAYMGITPVAEAKGDFSFTQDSITDTDEVFDDWENSDHQGVTPDNDTSEEAYAQWEISVGGSVQNPFTAFKLSDFEDQMVERVYKMDCQTSPPGGAYIADAVAKGIPLSVIMDKAGVDPSANALHSIADDGWDVYPVSMEHAATVQGRHLAGDGNQRREAGHAARLSGAAVDPHAGRLPLHQARRRGRCNFTTDPAEPRFFKGFTNPKTGEMFNKPNTSIFNYTNGTFFPVGQPIEFEGFADWRTKCPSLLWRYRWTRARPGTTFERAKPILCGGRTGRYSFTPETPGSYLIKVRAVAADGSVSTDPSQLFFNVK